jgi:hypothetical protein
MLDTGQREREKREIRMGKADRAAPQVLTPFSAGFFKRSRARQRMSNPHVFAFAQQRSKHKHKEIIKTEKFQ